MYVRHTGNTELKLGHINFVHKPVFCVWKKDGNSSLDP